MKCRRCQKRLTGKEELRNKYTYRKAAYCDKCEKAIKEATEILGRSKTVSLEKTADPVYKIRIGKCILIRTDKVRRCSRRKSCPDPIYDICLSVVSGKIPLPNEFVEVLGTTREIEDGHRIRWNGWRCIYERKRDDDN